MDKVTFTRMQDRTRAEYEFLNALVELDQGLQGYQITRLGHSLQSAPCNRPPAPGGTVPIRIGSSWRYCIIMATSMRHITMTNTPPPSRALSCAHNAHGSYKPTVISKCFTTARTCPVLTRTNATAISATPFSMIRPNFTSAGTRLALIRNMQPCRWTFSPPWGAKSLPARHTTQTLFGRASAVP